MRIVNNYLFEETKNAKDRKQKKDSTTIEKIKSDNNIIKIFDGIASKSIKSSKKENKD